MILETNQQNFLDKSKNQEKLGNKKKDNFFKEIEKIGEFLEDLDIYIKRAHHRKIEVIYLFKA